MSTNEIREKFLKFFESKGHKVVASDTLVPKDDPTVLFTTAGMQQFKRQFLGRITDFSKAATSQKCLRTDDLEEVGKTDFHHTFFEMLGNFSFGDYFKKEAICWAWEFLTKAINMPAEKLWVSVYKDDEEARNIWINDIKIPEERVVSLGDKSNFWPSNAKHDGPNGPCGPCSEIFYDFGENPNCKNDKCDPDCDCGRFSEIWNLVFTQFERQDGGVLVPLPSKNIDTGMGLERLAAVIQGKKNNFEIDIFAPIFQGIEQNIITDGVNLDIRHKRIIADHMRAIVIGISDGVVPSNEGRGYVIKKLIVDIADIVLQAGKTSPSIYTLVDAVIETMGVGYPELKGKNNEIADIIKNIESSYIRVRKERLPEFEKTVKDLLPPEGKVYNQDELAEKIGKQMFIFRDTYGVTLNSASIILDQYLMKYEKNEAIKNAILRVFNQEMNSQKEQSRQYSKMAGDVFTNTQLNLKDVESTFIGYDNSRCDTKITRLFSVDEQIDEANEGQDIIVILEQTPFYAESGGQVGDTGTFTNENGIIEIHDTQKIDNVHIHMGIVLRGSFKVGDPLTAEIDNQRRLAIMRNHTATHLLQKALRDVLGDTVKQQGSLVAEDRLRFDFTYHKALTNEQIMEIERCVNANILACDSVEKEILPIEEAKKKGALAFFAEKYGDIVRVVSISDYSIEFCGGTHLDSTGQIGLLRITQEGAVAQGIRRIEAKTGIGALELMYEQEDTIKKAASILKSNPKEFVDKLKTQTNRMKQLEKERAMLAFENIKTSLENKIAESEKLDETIIFSQCYTNIDIGTLRKIADFIKQKTKSAIILLGSKDKTSASLLVAVTEPAINKGFKANEIVNRIAPIINGTGGGRAQLAQAGSKNPEKLDEALKKAKQLIKDQ